MFEHRCLFNRAKPILEVFPVCTIHNLIYFSFCTDQVLRLSRELADVQSQCGDYYVLESGTDQGESDFQSFLTEEVRSPSPLESASSLNTTPTPMSPDELAQPPVDDTDDTRTLISDQPAEIKIKRTSSGKSPSKIPRFVGNSDDPRAAQISYYMSLKRGLKSPGSSQAKFFIQVQNSHNPYMHLMRSENLSRNKLYDSQSTVDSELEDSAFETYLQTGDQSIDGEQFHAQLGELVTLHLENRSLAPSVARTEQESLSDSRSSVGSFTEPTVSPNPIYQTLEQDLDTAEQELDSVRNCLDSVTESQSSVDSGLPLTPPPPPVPPRFEPENVIPPPVPPVPKASQREQLEEVVRTESNFTSYLAEAELQNKERPQVNKEDISAALLANGIQSWMWNDDSGNMCIILFETTFFSVNVSSTILWVPEVFVLSGKRMISKWKAVLEASEISVKCFCGLGVLCKRKIEPLAPSIVL